MGSDAVSIRSKHEAAISIHAPAWGATNIIYSVATVIADFNPRSRMGSDRPRLTSLSFATLFQSTLPHGERPAQVAIDDMDVHISIHAPAWGATNSMLADPENQKFQSTLPHGERRNNGLPKAHI